MRSRKDIKPPTAKERLAHLLSESEMSEVKILLYTDLHADEPNTKQETLLYCTQSHLVIYRDGEKAECCPLTDISEISLQKGVGCVWIECTDKESGEKRILVRGSAERKNDAAEFVKSASKLLRAREDAPATAWNKSLDKPAEISRKKALLRLPREKGTPF